MLVDEDHRLPDGVRSDRRSPPARPDGRSCDRFPEVRSTSTRTSCALYSAEPVASSTGAAASAGSLARFRQEPADLVHGSSGEHLFRRWSTYRPGADRSNRNPRFRDLTFLDPRETRDRRRRALVERELRVGDGGTSRKLGYPHGREHFARAEARLVRADDEVGDRSPTGRLAAAPRLDLGIESEQEGRGIRVWIGETQIPAQRPDLANAKVRYPSLHRRQRGSRSRTSSERSSSLCVTLPRSRARRPRRARPRAPRSA